MDYGRRTHGTARDGTGHAGRMGRRGAARDTRDGMGREGRHGTAERTGAGENQRKNMRKPRLRPQGFW
jgi:hypothetical protein